MLYSKFSLFSIISQSKRLENYHVANLAFCCLIELSLDFDKELKLNYYEADSDYYDIFEITDGLRKARIPAPLLEPKVRETLKLLSEVSYREDDRNAFLRVDMEILNIDPVSELRKLYEKVLELFPNAQQLAQKYLLKKDCSLCWCCPRGYENLTFSTARPLISCTVHPFGYPDVPLCKDWEIILESDEELLNQRIGIAKRTKVVRLANSTEKRYVYIQPEISSRPLTLKDGIYLSVTHRDNSNNWVKYKLLDKVTLESGVKQWLVCRAYEQHIKEVWVEIYGLLNIPG